VRLFIFGALMLMASGCADAQARYPAEGIPQGSIVPTEIQGMDCLVMSYTQGAGHGRTGFGGLTCDWGPQ
jgi:hypothetical protein